MNVSYYWSIDKLRRQQYPFQSQVDEKLVLNERFVASFCLFHWNSLGILDKIIWYQYQIVIYYMSLLYIFFLQNRIKSTKRKSKVNRNHIRVDEASIEK